MTEGPWFIEINRTMAVTGGEGTDQPTNLEARLIAKIQEGDRRGKGFKVVGKDWPDMIEQLRIWSEMGRPVTLEAAQEAVQESNRKAVEFSAATIEEDVDA